jgi:hypothetical protein
VFDLTDEFLQLRLGVIRYYRADLDHPVTGTWSIEIPLPPFSAEDEYEPSTFRPGPGGPTLIETEISLDFIKLPADHLAALNQQTFAFPRTSKRVVTKYRRYLRPIQIFLSQDRSYGNELWGSSPTTASWPAVRPASTAGHVAMSSAERRIFRIRQLVATIHGHGQGDLVVG